MEVSVRLDEFIKKKNFKPKERNASCGKGRRRAGDVVAEEVFQQNLN